LATAASGLVVNNALNVDFVQGLMAFRNQAGGNVTSDVQITALYRRRQ